MTTKTFPEDTLSMGSLRCSKTCAYLSASTALQQRKKKKELIKNITVSISNKFQCAIIQCFLKNNVCTWRTLYNWLDHSLFSPVPLFKICVKCRIVEISPLWCHKKALLHLIHPSEHIEKRAWCQMFKVVQKVFILWCLFSCSVKHIYLKY